MKTEQPTLITSVQNKSGATIPQGHFVLYTGSQGNSSEDNNQIIGVCNTETDDLEYMPVVVSGIALVLSGGLINAGSKVYTDGGPAYAITFTDPPTAAELQQVVGMALDAAAGAGELIRVLLR
jgi:Uncharacterized conserved protein (DUF2190)